MTIHYDNVSDVYFLVRTPRFARGARGRFIAQTGAMISAASKAFDDLLIRLRKREERTFHERQTTWQPLNKEYKAWKASHGLDTRILIATGSLLKSVTQKTAYSIADLMKFGGGSRMRFGTSRPYAGTHQKGKSIRVRGGWVKIPRRPFLVQSKGGSDAAFFMARFRMYYATMIGYQAGRRIHGTEPVNDLMALGYLMGGQRR
jgi:phage gpG-like protein